MYRVVKMTGTQTNPLQTIELSFGKILPYLRKFASAHNDAYPENSSIIISGANLLSTGLVTMGYEYIARLFITRTHTSWESKNRKAVLMSLLMYMETMTNTTFANVEEMYDRTSSVMIEEFWKIAVVLIPACLEYAYILRGPYVDKTTGKTKYKENFPKEGSVLKIVALTKVWNGDESV
jgi:hypothetical protein